MTALSPRTPLLALAFTGLAAAALAQAPDAQTSAKSPDLPRASVPAIQIPALLFEDLGREQLGLPPRYAVPFAVSHRPEDSGVWDSIDDNTLRWRLLVTAPGALSINLGFSEFELPKGATLTLNSSAGQVGPFTDQDNAEHGELWTPVLAGEEVVVELILPADRFEDFTLKLGQVGSGYRGFGITLPGGGGIPVSGSCNVDVVCPEGNGWESEIAAVGVISTGGSTFCTGYMVNNTANDRKPYFMTANHCGVSSGNAASLVVFWNYQTTTCGGATDGQLNQFQTGSFFRASNSTSDFTLVELDSDPDPAWDVAYAGWDRSGAEATNAIAIHHPQTDEKRISFEFAPTATTAYLGDPGSGSSHVRVLDWDIGTTEPGSSGSPLFDQNQRVIGQLHGGYAACGNDLADWYGRFSVSWNGGGSATSRLRDWLDPGNTGALSVDSLGVGLSIVKSVEALHEGPILGPFTNATVPYTLTNKTLTPIQYEARLGAGNPGLLLAGGTAPQAGTLAAGASAQFDVTLGAAAGLLPSGLYQGELIVEDLSNGVLSGLNHNFEVGRATAFEFTLDTNPGWTGQGAWAFGVPQGNTDDPSSGFTGQNVWGYNLSGDYTDNLGTRDLFTPALDMSGLTGATLEFQRWLAVESSQFDNADVFVSNDGLTRDVLWQNGGTSVDAAWVPMSLDISGTADGESAVQLGWRMGGTDSSVTYGGWNIDDVRVTGFTSFTPYGTPCSGSTAALGGSGDPTAGGAVDLELSGGLPGGQVFVFFSSQLQVGPLEGCDVLIGASGGTFFTGALDGAGAVNLPVTLPGFVTAGQKFFLQGLGVDFGAPNGLFSLTNGLELTVR